MNKLFKCPKCGEVLKFTGKRELDVDCFDDAGASFFTCKCGIRHYDWGDTLPQNCWRLKPDGTWSFLDVNKTSNWERIYPMRWCEKPKPYPQPYKFIFR